MLRSLHPIEVVGITAKKKKQGWIEVVGITTKKKKKQGWARDIKA